MKSAAEDVSDHTTYLSGDRRDWWNVAVRLRRRRAAVDIGKSDSFARIA